MIARVCWLVVPLLVASCAGREGMLRWEDAEPGPSRPSPAPSAVDPPRPTPPSVVSAARPPPALPQAPIAAPAALRVAGVIVEDGALAELPALELACLADARALSEPADVLARLDEVGRKVGASLGDFAFVVLERDPAKALTDPPPRACRALQAEASLVAPLTRHREAAARWLVRRAREGVVVDTAALLADCQRRGLTPSARPRVLVDERGALVAVAVPVQGGS